MVGKHCQEKLFPFLCLSWKQCKPLVNRALAIQPCALFVDLIVPKCSERDSFLTFSGVQIELSLQPSALFADNFCRSRPAHAETDTLLRWPRTPFYPKKHRVWRIWRPRIHVFPACYISQLLDDDVVDMMMWLTWWWECCPWQSSVTRKFSNWTSFENW